MDVCFEICQAPGFLQGARLGIPRMLASAPVSVWLQPLARGCGPEGQVAFAHAASLTLWSQVKMEVDWLVPDTPEQALAAVPAALLAPWPSVLTVRPIFTSPVQALPSHRCNSGVWRPNFRTMERLRDQTRGALLLLAGPLTVCSSALAFFLNCWRDLPLPLQILQGLVLPDKGCS